MRGDEYFRAVRLYRGLPGVVVLTMIVVFLVFFSLTGKPALSAVAAAVPSILLLWRWIVAARQIDQWVCTNCGQRLPKKLYWIYPPGKCPQCGGRVP